MQHTETYQRLERLADRLNFVKGWVTNTDNGVVEVEFGHFPFRAIFTEETKRCIVLAQMNTVHKTMAPTFESNNGQSFPYTPLEVGDVIAMTCSQRWNEDAIVANFVPWNTYLNYLHGLEITNPDYHF